MYAMYCASKKPLPTAIDPIEKHSLLALDKWVRTEHNGMVATGRVLAVLREPDGELLYEVELPLQTCRGGMTRVIRCTRDIFLLG